MIWAFFGLIALFAAYLTNKNDVINENLKYVLIFIGGVLILADTYTYLVLPAMISNFYNEGDGITYGDHTLFDENDAKLAYFFSQVQYDYVWLETLKTMAFWALPILLMFMFVKYLQGYNQSGEKLP